MAMAALVGLLIGLPTSPATADTPNAHTIATYNSQGARWSDVRQLSNENDIVAVQEAGSEPSLYGMILQQSYNRSGYTVHLYRWGARYVYWMSPLGDTRVNLAMVTHTMAHEVYVAPPGRAGARPALGLRFDDDIYYNVHALATGAHNEAQELVRQVRNQATSAGRSWTVMGDFNRDPDQGMHTLAAGLGAQVYHTGDATQQSGGELDYMISSRALANYRGVRMGGRGSDHYPVYFRTQMVANGSVVELTSDSDHEKYLTFERGSNANGTHLVSDTWNPSKSQWKLRSVPGAGKYDFNFVNRSTGKCIDVDNGRFAKMGDGLNEWDCEGQTSQVFSIYYWGEEPGTWLIKQKNTDLCVNTTGAKPRVISLWTCADGTPSQRFLPHFYG